MEGGGGGGGRSIEASVPLPSSETASEVSQSTVQSESLWTLRKPRALPGVLSFVPFLARPGFVFVLLGGFVHFHLVLLSCKAHSDPENLWCEQTVRPRKC